MSLKSRLITTEYFKEWDVDILLDILENADNAIIVIDYKGTVVYINRFYAERMGVKPEKLLGRNLYDIEPQAKLIRVMEEGGSQEENKVEYIKSLKIDSVGLAFPLYNQKKEKVGACAIFKDVTQVVELTRKLQKTKEMVQYLASQLEASELPISFQSYISLNKELKKTLSLAAKVANTNCTILIQGESGVGKEVMAKCIHSASNRKEQPMVKVNCASIPENLLESELFGYEEGAFTGARKGGRIGKIQLANHGTFFLDEIGDMPLYLQAKLLRVLSERKVDRIGSSSSSLINVDVRIIAATNRNLEEMIERKEFREDLYYRLNVVPLHLPPLRERPDDIPFLIQHFIAKYNKILEKEIRTASAPVMELMMKYRWPGNVRELENSIEYMMTFEKSPVLSLEATPQKILSINNETGKGCHRTGGETSCLPLKTSLRMKEQEILRTMAARYGGHPTKEQVREICKYLEISVASYYRKIGSAAQHE